LRGSPGACRGSRRPLAGHARDGVLSKMPTSRLCGRAKIGDRTQIGLRSCGASSESTGATERSVPRPDRRLHQAVAHSCDQWGYGLRCASFRCPLPSAFMT
jgi:hypothetical protein